MIVAVAVGVAVDQDHRFSEIQRMREQLLPELSVVVGRAVRAPERGFG